MLGVAGDDRVDFVLGRIGFSESKQEETEAKGHHVKYLNNEGSLNRERSKVRGQKRRNPSDNPFFGHWSHHFDLNCAIFL